jgi:hypothetical protein
MLLLLLLLLTGPGLTSTIRSPFQIAPLPSSAADSPLLLLPPWRVRRHRAAKSAPGKTTFAMFVSSGKYGSAVKVSTCTHPPKRGMLPTC